MVWRTTAPQVAHVARQDVVELRGIRARGLEHLLERQRRYGPKPTCELSKEFGPRCPGVVEDRPSRRQLFCTALKEVPVAPRTPRDAVRACSRRQVIRVRGRVVLPSCISRRCLACLGGSGGGARRPFAWVSQGCVEVLGPPHPARRLDQQPRVIFSEILRAQPRSSVDPHCLRRPPQWAAEQWRRRSSPAVDNDGAKPDEVLDARERQVQSEPLRGSTFSGRE